MLEACHLIKRFFGITVVNDISFVVRPGEVAGYLGANGSGKTTTARMLTGLVEQSSGSILVDGRDIHDDIVGFRRRLGYVPEEPHLYPFLSGREQLQLVGRLRDMPAALLDHKIEALTALFGLAGAADQSIASYSKGMKQKILIIAALLHDPDVLIFDEPDSGLDATAMVVLEHVIRTLAERGKTIMYSSHVLGVVEKLCTRIVILHRGRIVADDSAEHLEQLMGRPSLDEVFGELVSREDPATTARDIVNVVALHD